MTKNKKDETTAVVATANKAVVASSAADYAEYANQGFESHTQDDYAVPFLGVLQPLSPLLETDATARAGMLVNTVTQRSYEGKETGVLFVPACTDHVVNEWIPRDLGGGFVARHAVDSEIVVRAKTEQEFGKYKTVKGDPKSNDLIETYNVYGIFIDPEGNWEQMVMSFTSTKIKIYKRWMTKARTVQLPLPDGRRINPPLFAHKYRVTTVAEKNAKGSFYNLNIDFDGKSAEAARLGTTDPLFQAAVSFADLIKSDKVKVAHDSQTTTMGTANVDDDQDIPFN